MSAAFDVRVLNDNSWVFSAVCTDRGRAELLVGSIKAIAPAPVWDGNSVYFLVPDGHEDRAEKALREIGHRVECPYYG